ncbi:hypothetical protein GP486_006998 [Trichoglossum hirsutum]|uniref:Uncharacterized protein n=1 Tax=Trichoglossum hirsutum TaxID=265104 RepID=A0A9P8IJS2_9PEZI|nr:hypothetical protein GP486_006998 [Trichoglossum hirsutum]
MALPYFSAREVVLIAQVAYKIYDAYTRSPREFQVLAREGLTLDAALKSAVEEAEKTFPGDQISTQYRTRLAHLAIGAKELLEELDALLKKYESLLTNKYSKRDRLLFGKEDVEKLRTRIAFHVAAIHGFQTDMVKLRTDGISIDVKQILEILVQAKSREEAATSASWRETNTQGLYEALEERGVSQEFMTQNSKLIVDLIVDVVKRHELAQEPSATADGCLCGFPAGDGAQNEIILEEINLPCTCGTECTGECLRAGRSPSFALTDWTGPTAVGSPTSQSPIEGAREVKQSILHAVSKRLQQIGSTSVAHDGVPFQSSTVSVRRLPHPQKKLQIPEKPHHGGAANRAQGLQIGVLELLEVRLGDRSVIIQLGGEARRVQ